MSLNIGDILQNRYHITKIIAKGGMGSIFEAIDQSLQIKVAIKENLFSTEHSTRQFQREANILASLRHKNLPRVTDHFTIPDQGQYLVMDFIEGEDLKERLEHSGTLPEEEIILIGAAICDALDYLHNRTNPIIHRDIKPGNIKITPTGEIFLVDFGIAKIDEGGKATTTGAQSLTPGFAPPEQYGQGTDPRSDYYALGATLYLALTGFVPENSLARMMGESELTPITQYKKKANPGLVSTIEKSLAIQKENRFQTAKDFKRNLLLSSKETSGLIDSSKDIRVETPPTKPHQTIKPDDATRLTPNIIDEIQKASQPVKKRSPFFIIAGIVIVIILCLGSVGGYIAYSNGMLDELLGTPGESTSETTIEQIRPTNTEELVTENNHSTPTNEDDIEESLVATETLSPTITETPETVYAETQTGGGTGEILFVSDRSGTPQLYLINSDGTGLEQITNEINGACQPDWSPDGKQIVFVSPCSVQSSINASTETYSGAAIYIINSDGTGKYNIPSIPGGDFDPSWSPDGSTIAYTSYRDHLSGSDLNLYLFKIETNEVIKLTGDLYVDRRPAWSPDGTKIVFQRQPQGLGNQIHIYDLESNEISLFSSENDAFAFMPDWSINDTICFSHGNPFPNPVVRQFGTLATAQVTLSESPGWYVDYSSDGNWLVFERIEFYENNTRNYDIFIMSANGGNAIRLTTDESRDYQPVWKP